MPIQGSVTAAFLAWLVPGLGHIYQGRVAKGLLFFVCLMGTFMWGMYLGEWKVVYWAWDDRQPVIEGLCRCGMVMPSLPSVLQSLSRMDEFRKKDGGLAVIGHFQATPTRPELDELHARLGRVWNIAQVYTMIASLLNILVILDARNGPAEQIYAESRGPEEERRAA